MLSLLRGPGGPFRRFAAELVPFLAAGTLAWMAGALLGLVAALLLGAVLWPALSGVLRAVRRRPRLLRLYRGALGAHVLVWGALGWRGSTPSEPVAPGPVEQARWAAAAPLRAGAADVPVALPARVPLGGWSQRPRRLAAPAFGGLGMLGRLSRASMALPGVDGPLAPLFRQPEPGGDAVSARALLLAGPEGSPPLAVVRVDLLTSDAPLAAALAERVRDLGIVPATLLLCASHTHSGPGGYARDALAQVLALDHFDPAVFEALLTACEQALRQAHAALRPARLALAEGRDRGADGQTILAATRGAARGAPVEDRVALLSVEGDDGRPLALLVSYGVHPVVRRRDHARLSRDLAGAVEDALAERLPGRPPVLFLQAGLGDVSPRVAVTPEAPGALETAAARFAEAQLPVLGPAARWTHLRIESARTQVPLGGAHLWACWGERSVLLDDEGGAPFSGSAAGAAADLALLPLNALLWSLTLTDTRLVGSPRGALGVRLNLAPQAAAEEQPLGALLLELGDGAGRALRLPLVWLPAEPTQSVAEALRGAAGPGAARPLVVSLTNGSMAYATDREQYRRGGYEAAATLYGAGTEAALLLAARRLFATLGR